MNGKLLSERTAFLQEIDRCVARQERRTKVPPPLLLLSPSPYFSRPKPFVKSAKKRRPCALNKNASPKKKRWRDSEKKRRQRRDWDALAEIENRSFISHLSFTSFFFLFSFSSSFSFIFQVERFVPPVPTSPVPAPSLKRGREEEDLSPLSSSSEDFGMP